MKTVIQRVRDASVTVEGEVTGSIRAGLLVLAGFAESDTPADLRAMAEKMINLRIFADDEGRMNRSLLEAGGGILVVSQFTLYADCRKGRRPSFTGAASPALAERLYGEFVEICRALIADVATGRFGAMMDVAFTNCGPVTILLDSADLNVR